jgi:diguanylate cyclase (GGDEF)-like protein/PAS domain S-box-containing protein
LHSDIYRPVMSITGLPPLPDAAPETVEALRARLTLVESELRACAAEAERATGALRAIADGVATVDLKGYITSFNPGAAHLVGWSEAEAVGRRLHEILDLRDDHGTSLDLLVAGSKEGHDVASLMRRDRHALLVEATFAPILDPERKPIGSVVTFRNVTVAKRRTDELAYQATHDALTGLVNRRAFESRLQRALDSASRQDCRHTLLFLDMDRFKAVNDSAGHAAGDALLRQLAVLLKKHLRDRDVLGRLGGDEFAVLLENTTPVHADVVSERLRDAVAGFRFTWQDQVFAVGVSIGQVNFSDGTLTLRELMNRADKMCYQAKSKGRNRVAVYVPTSGPQRRRATATSRLPEQRRPPGDARR